MPPGKTHAPLLWSPRPARLDSSTSRPRAPARMTTIVAAGRGGRSLPATAGAGKAEAFSVEAGIWSCTVAAIKFGTTRRRARHVGAVRQRRMRTPDTRSAAQPIGAVLAGAEDVAVTQPAPREASGVRDASLCRCVLRD